MVRVDHPIHTRWSISLKPSETGGILGIWPRIYPGRTAKPLGLEVAYENTKDYPELCASELVYTGVWAAV